MFKNIIVIVLILTLAATGLAGCSKDGGENIMNGPTVKADTIGDEVVLANSRFAFDIFRAVYNADTEGNIFLSPASISMALAMTWNGANGNTKNEMAKALGFDGVHDMLVNGGFAYLVDILNTDADGITTDLANSIWIREGFTALDSFKKINSDYFAAMIEELDFSRDDASDIINGWVEENTKGLIDSIVDDDIHPATIMFLINTIYFKGNWQVEFDPDKTYESDFYVDGTSTGKVDMMSYKGNTLFYDAGEYKIISLPYGDGGMFMDLILPKEETSMDTFVNQFDYNGYVEALAGISEKHDVIVGVPKFQTEYELSLKNALISLGMEEAFTGAADFTGINESGNIFISDVKHKTYIDVNEKGTEAAAVTSVEMKLTAVMDPIEFIADRPFMYTIREAESGSILFSGIFDTPAE